MMKKTLFTTAMFIATAAILGGCATAPTSETGRASLQAQVAHTVDLFQREDPGIKKFLAESSGYAVFPTVGKGGVGIGGAYGKGELLEAGVVVGYCDLSQATIGFQLGGQAYRELICFEDKESLDAFKSGNFAFSAQASAVAVKAGASADVDYERGVAVFTMAKGGLMYEASVGGQKFSFVPK